MESRLAGLLPRRRGGFLQPTGRETNCKVPPTHTCAGAKVRLDNSAESAEPAQGVRVHASGANLLLAVMHVRDLDGGLLDLVVGVLVHHPPPGGPPAKVDS